MLNCKSHKSTPLSAFQTHISMVAYFQSPACGRRQWMKRNNYEKHNKDEAFCNKNDNQDASWKENGERPHTACSRDLVLKSHSFSLPPFPPSYLESLKLGNSCRPRFRREEKAQKLRGRSYRFPEARAKWENARAKRSPVPLSRFAIAGKAERKRQIEGRTKRPKSSPHNPGFL